MLGTRGKPNKKVTYVYLKKIRPLEESLKNMHKLHRKWRG